MTEVENGGTELTALLKHMQPMLLPEEYVFVSFESGSYGDYANLTPIASFQEKEGLTLVVPRSAADHSQHAYSGVFKCITLQIHSSLEAVGLTAAFATQLTEHGISANVIAGFYHDHIFVGLADASKALSALKELSSAG